MTVASFQTGALLTLVLPVALLLLVGGWWAWAARRRREL
jgi:cytochrome c-type biogenesis protein CcmH/NrfF